MFSLLSLFINYYRGVLKLALSLSAVLLIAFKLLFIVDISTHNLHYLSMHNLFFNSWALHYLFIYYICLVALTTLLKLVKN